MSSELLVGVCDHEEIVIIQYIAGVDWGKRDAMISTASCEINKNFDGILVFFVGAGWFSVQSGEWWGRSLLPAKRSLSLSRGGRSGRVDMWPGLPLETFVRACHWHLVIESIQWWSGLAYFWGHFISQIIILGLFHLQRWPELFSRRDWEHSRRNASLGFA